MRRGEKYLQVGHSRSHLQRYQNTGVVNIRNEQIYLLIVRRETAIDSERSGNNRVLFERPTRKVEFEGVIFQDHDRLHLFPTIGFGTPIACNAKTASLPLSIAKTRSRCVMAIIRCRTCGIALLRHSITASSATFAATTSVIWFRHISAT